ncbi:hypothetical protein PS858_01434 [Pseudomonas fluorescens]|nr:hypothetical protein PS858_01434 [Pseudomonas fluorescens]
MQVAEKYTEVRRAMADIFERNHRCYGYRQMRASLSRQRVRLSEKEVQRLMKQECLVVAKPKRRRYGSYLGEISPAPETSSTATSRLLLRMRNGSLTLRSSRTRPARCTCPP